MDMFTALADPTRRTIVELLATHGQLPASDIYIKFNVSHPAISQHLKVLKEAEVVSVEKQAQQRLYKLNPNKLDELHKWIEKLTRVYEERFQRLDALLEIEKKKLNRKGGV